VRNGLIVLSLTALAEPALAQANYQRAEQFLTWNAIRYLYHDQVAPSWYRDSTRFWYKVHTPSGDQFLTVTPATGAKAPLFDNARLAAALSMAADTAVDPVRLPFPTVQFDRDGSDESAIRLRIGKRGFRCELATYRCATADTLPNLTRFVRSPDEKWEAFVSKYNLWVRPVGGGDSIQLTTDGVEQYGYGQGAPSPTQQRLHLPVRPTVVWSPDSKRLAVTRIDERNVGTFSVVSMTSTRPVAYSYPYALPGDSIVPMADWYVADVGQKRAVRLEGALQPEMSFYGFGAVGLQWTPGGDRLAFTVVDRGPKKVRLLSADPATGKTTQILADSSKSYVVGSVDLTGSATNWKLLANGDVVWLAERDGFAHLYHHRADGSVAHRITEGPSVVAGLVAVDEAAGRVYFTAKGRNPEHHPDYAELYSVGLDGSGLTALTPEPAQHQITLVPGLLQRRAAAEDRRGRRAAASSGPIFLDTYSTVDRPAVTVLRDGSGRVIAELEKADASGLQAFGWKPGRTFMAKARDGVTDVWGVIWLPSTFDSTRRYPVIDHIYPGPLISPASKIFFPNREPFTYPMTGQVQALAELGFIVVSIDAIGNTGRAKSLYTQWYGNMGDNGIPDHIAVIKQLAARIPQMDLERVGIYGHSGGGFASTDALLRYPDFFKVAVSTSGNHDNRTYYHGWGERFQGLLVRDTAKKTDNYEAAANKSMAGNLKGKLFLMHGDMDDNVHPAHTIALVDALIKANKSFDLLIIPDATHDISTNAYAIRRTWDYFVANLLGEEPPQDYLLRGPPQ
jgi:dipeptidyl aminopeptidase/acylaminoacyl peptidase